MRTVHVCRPQSGCAMVSIFTVIFCEVLGERFPSRCLQESLCGSCAQMDQVAVTCNESLALRIMSAPLDKSLHFQRIGPIASNMARENKSKGGGGVTKPTPASGAARAPNGLRPISIFISTLRAKWIIYWSDNHHPSLPIPSLCGV